jgi:hypothetical protein
VTFDIIDFTIHTKGKYVLGANASVVACVDVNMKAVGQLIFKGEPPKVDPVTSENLAALAVQYNLNGSSQVEMNFYAGVYTYEENPDPALTEEEEYAEYQQMVINHTNTYLKEYEMLPLDVFDYKQAINQLQVSYVAVRASDEFPRFAKDPLFSLVFINNEVAIFKVHK